jgi:hypothetical protein
MNEEIYKYKWDLSSNMIDMDEIMLKLVLNTNQSIKHD